MLGYFIVYFVYLVKYNFLTFPTLIHKLQDKWLWATQFEQPSFTKPFFRHIWVVFKISIQFPMKILFEDITSLYNLSFSFLFFFLFFLLLFRQKYFLYGLESWKWEKAYWKSEFKCKSSNLRSNYIKLSTHRLSFSINGQISWRKEIKNRLAEWQENYWEYRSGFL